MKTEVIIKFDVNESELKTGDCGYIDGYVRAADDRAYACVVIPERGIVDFAPLYALQAIGVKND